MPRAPRAFPNPKPPETSDAALLAWIYATSCEPSTRLGKCSGSNKKTVSWIARPSKPTERLLETASKNGEGIGINSQGPWGYHSLIISLAET